MKLYCPAMHDDTHLQPPDAYSPQLVDQIGLSRKYIFDVVGALLERLGTEYIAVLQLHYLDRNTPAKEFIRAL
jgi:aryl-alcohol dehydrogenase-like predicted oxidoreductase